MRRSVIAGTGSFLPPKILTNDDLSRMVETSDEWIVQRTGIRERHIAGEDETAGTMGIEAARRALAASGLTAADIDAVIVATSTPDNTFPSTATKIQAALGIAPCPCFDIQAVCSGFVYGLGVADSFIQNGMASHILLIGSEKMSSILNWEDRTTCVLFGDGAGAIVLSAAEGKGTPTDRGLLSHHLYAQGDLRDILYVNGGPSTTGESGHIVMEGREVFRHAVERMAAVVSEVIEKNGIKASDIQWLVPHQANIRIIEATAKKLDLDMSQVVVTVDRHGNTSAASIPLALDEAVRGGRIKKGDLILFEALGAGLTWGACLARF